MQSFVICILKTRITKITCCLVSANDGDFFSPPSGTHSSDPVSEIIRLTPTKIPLYICRYAVAHIITAQEFTKQVFYLSGSKWHKTNTVLLLPSTVIISYPSN